MQLVSRLSSSLVFLLLATTAISCSEEDDKNGNGNPTFSRDQYLGTYICTEQIGPNAPQNYSVEILSGPDENDLLISGLANLGSSFILEAEAVGRGFNIPLQTVDGIIVSGTAVTDKSISPMDLLFDLNDGSGNTSTEGELIKQ
jgi:hypothetical protein